MAKEYALPYQPISLVLLKSAVIRGIAVAMMDESKDMRNMASPRPAMTKTSGKPVSS